MESVDPVKELYRQRDKLIILGLTGRTGAGCTTVANMLSKEKMEDLDLRSYKTCDYNNADERKYSILYRFMKEGKHWKRFKIIEASTIIFSFVLEGSYKRLFNFIDSILEKDEIKNREKVKQKILDVLKKDASLEINNIENVIIDENVGKYLKIMDSSVDIKELLNIIDYFTISLKNKKNEFRKAIQGITFGKELNGHDEIEVYNLYTYFMQEIANNIRASSKYDSNEVIPGNEIVVAERINRIIKVINKSEELENKNNEQIRICIDALRNSAEILFFRDRYRAFYAMAVSTDDNDRKNRLDLNKKEIQSLDKIEYPDDNKIFHHQNIQSCLQISDIYIYNPNVTDNRYYKLSEQLLKYIALILKPGLITPTHVERCMQLAFNAKYNSGCLSRQVGAVVTGIDFSVKSVGWNDVPKGQVPCNLRCVEDYCRNKDGETFSEFELNDPLFDETMSMTNQRINTKNIKNIKKGRYYAYCFKDVYNGITRKSNQVYTRALHAEENAFLQIAKYGGAEIQGGKLFTTASPCELCSKKAYQLGIKEIYYIDPYPGISKSHILKFGKNNNPKMILFQGAIGNAYISLYSPRISYKDEIELVTKINIKSIGEEIYDKHKDDK